MVAIVHNSNLCLEYLLKCGGIDLDLVDNQGRNLLQLAMHCKNNTALELLMKVEKKSKKVQVVNRKRLKTPI